VSSSSPFAGAIDLSKIGGQQAPAADDVTKGVDVLDSEVNKIHDVLQTIRKRSMSARNLDDFQREIKQRFEDIGFVVRVNWHDTNVEGTFIPEIVITARTERKVFDRDQMVHEVTNDILGLGDGGIISTDKSKVSAMLDGSYKGSAKGVHKH
jgi:hypothetical protein